MEEKVKVEKIIDPKIPIGVYPTSDTLITMTVDVDRIFRAKSQQDVIDSVFFDDNRDNDPPRTAPEYTSDVPQNRFITWIGAVKNAEKHPKYEVMIYDISDNPAMLKPSPYRREPNTIQNALSIDKPIGPTEYSIIFWVYNSDYDGGKGRGFKIDPKLQVNH